MSPSAWPCRRCAPAAVSQAPRVAPGAPLNLECEDRMVEEHPVPLRRFCVTITCRSLWERETVVVWATDAGKAKPAAIAVCRLPVTGEIVDFDVREVGDSASPTTAL